MVGLHDTLLHGEVQDTDDDDEGQEHGQTELGQCSAEQSHVQAVQGEGDHDTLDDDLGGAFPDTGVGLTVELLHDRFHVFGGANLHVVDLLFHLLLGLDIFLKKAHSNSP